MAKEAPAAEKKPAEAAPAEKGGSNLKKMIMFGVPIFLVQLVVIYFLTAKFIVPMTASAHTTGHETATENTTGEKEGEAAEADEGHGDAKEDHIYVVKDLIINPAGTNGTRFLLTTIGFKVSSAGAEAELEKKDIELRDILNTTLTSKGLDELIDVHQRDSLRSEITGKVSAMMKTGKLRNVFFSKFIIQ